MGYPPFVFWRLCSVPISLTYLWFLHLVMLFPVVSVLALTLLTSPIAARKFKREGAQSTHPDAYNIHVTAAGHTISSKVLGGVRAPVADTTTDKVLSLSKVKSSSQKSSSAYRFTKRATIANGSASVLTSLFEGEEFSTPVTFGDTTLDLIVDTGSSDTWVIGEGFGCISLSTGRSTTQATCAFGPTYSTDSTFEALSSSLEFDIQYGDGEYLTGTFGTDNVTLAGLTVSQQIAVVDSAAWNGDGVTSGLLGLAYPAMYVLNSQHANLPIPLTVQSTSAYQGNGQVEYDGIITTLSNEGLIDSLFSIVIERDLEGDAGYLALGGVPPIAFTQNFTATPIIVTSIEGYPETYDFYTINIDAITIAGTNVSGASSYEYIVRHPSRSFHQREKNM